MVAIARGQTSSPQQPYLTTFVVAPVEPLWFAPEVIEYAIFDCTSGVPEQVFPEVVGERAVVDVRAAPVGDMVSPGRYAARWAVPAGAKIGRHEVRWYWRRFLADVEELSFAEPFEVVAQTRMAAHAFPAYALVADLRDEGVRCYDDATLHQKIVRASLLFEQYTGRTFTPRYKLLRAFARGHGTLYLEEPIIALDRVLLRDQSAVPLSTLRVYNRHSAYGLTSPDDRDNPRIEYAYGSWFGQGFRQPNQSVLVGGVFGYTDYVAGGPPAGVTPELVGQAVRLLVMRDLPALTEMADREDAQKRWKLTSESTRDQSYTMFGGVDAATRGALVGGTTGDPEIDNLIILYRRGTQIGAA